MGNAGQPWQKADIAPDAVKPAERYILRNTIPFVLQSLHAIVSNFVIKADKRGIVTRCQKTGQLPGSDGGETVVFFSDSDTSICRGAVIADGL